MSNNLALPTEVGDKVREKVKSAIFDLLPDGVIDTLIQSMITEMIDDKVEKYITEEKVDQWGATRIVTGEKAANIYTLVLQNVRNTTHGLFNQMIREYAQKIIEEKSQELFTQVVAECAPAVLEGIVRRYVGDTIASFAGQGRTY